MENQGIIGAVCGDIIGSAYEFHKTKDINFKLFTPQSTFTDDTVMTCAVAEWLIEDPDHTHEALVEIMHRYGEEFPHAGYGGMFGQWLRRHLTEPYNSFGNGSAMRVSPTAYYANSFGEALQLAQISAEVTHDHPEGIIGAQAVAAAIYIMRTDGAKNPRLGWEKITEYLEKYCFYKMRYRPEEWERHVRDYLFDVTCQGSVPEAVICALGTEDYEYSIRRAVSLGGDADTQAAITGGIVAANSPVPDHILNECLDRLEPRLADVIDRFNNLCQKRQEKS